MNKYYIENEEGDYWCNNRGGYWSSIEGSLKYRFQGLLVRVLFLYLTMKLFKVKCKLVVVK